MSQVRLINDAAGRDEAGLAELAACFQSIAAQLLTAPRVAAAVTAEPTAQANITAPLAALLAALPARSPAATAAPPAAAAPAPTVAWSVNVPVAYVARVFRTIPYGDPDAAPLLVLAKLLRANFLHREIREKGGAYGGLAGYNADGGLLSLLSYRDPQLLRTLDVYRQAVEWASRGEFTEEMRREAILAVFGELDRPLSPGGRGHREFLCQRQGLTVALRQALRDRVLPATTPPWCGWPGATCSTASPPARRGSWPATRCWMRPEGSWKRSARGSSGFKGGTSGDFDIDAEAPRRGENP